MMNAAWKDTFLDDNYVAYFDAVKMNSVESQTTSILQEHSVGLFRCSSPGSYKSKNRLL